MYPCRPTRQYLVYHTLPSQSLYTKHRKNQAHPCRNLRIVWQDKSSSFCIRYRQCIDRFIFYCQKRNQVSLADDCTCSCHRLVCRQMCCPSTAIGIVFLIFLLSQQESHTLFCLTTHEVSQVYRIRPSCHILVSCRCIILWIMVMPFLPFMANVPTAFLPMASSISAFAVLYVGFTVTYEN